MFGFGTGIGMDAPENALHLQHKPSGAIGLGQVVTSAHAS